MVKLVLYMLLATWFTHIACMEPVNNTELLTNSSDPNKDMYVINAMVYQVGILTNKTDNETANLNTTGNQESVTFYHNNGSQVDLSKIDNPLLTNVTAQSLVGVAPVSGHPVSASNQLPWSNLNHLANMTPTSESTVKAGSDQAIKHFRRSIRKNDFLDSEIPFNRFYKSLFKRDVAGNTPVSIRNGAAVIPQAAGVQSIAIPPLLTLNNNLSNIPVPIPNTSVVHYAKINTLVTKTIR